MIRALEFGVAGVAAIGLHLAAFSLLPSDAVGAIAAGDQGQALVSLAPSDPALAALVDSWEAPPEMPPLPPALKAPDLKVEAIALPEVASVGSVSLPQAMEPPPAEAKPAVEPAPPKPEAKPEPAPKQEPEPKPKAKAEPKPDSAPEKPVKKSQASTAQTAQKSAGSGGGDTAGAGGKAAAATLSAGQQEAAMATWGAAIRSKIERRKSYPAAAKGAAGKVVLRLKVAANGQLQAVSIAKSSGNAALDQAAVKAVKAAGKFGKAPKGLGAASFTLPISFNP